MCKIGKQRGDLEVDKREIWKMENKARGKWRRKQEGDLEIEKKSRENFCKWRTS
jgi:hypothetical protein